MKKTQTAQITVQQFFKAFSSDDACLAHLFNVRFGQGHECPKCTRSAKWYHTSGNAFYSCQWCGHHIHPRAGTLFEDSRTSLQSWFYAMYLFTTTRHGVSAKELQRQLGVTYKTAWRMGHEIRKHMARVDGNDPLSGIVEVDETMIGGVRPGKRGRGAAGKTVVFGMLERNGDVMTKVVPNVRRSTLHPLIEENVEAGSEIHSDELLSYRTIDTKGYTHKTVEHGAGEYVKGDTHVNSLEGFWSHLQKSIHGTHIHVSGKHLEKYAGEFEFRFNARNHPETMLSDLLTKF